MVMQDRIEHLRRSILQNRIGEMEEYLGSRDDSGSASRLPLRRVASTGSGLAQQRRRDILEELRHTEALLSGPPSITSGPYETANVPPVEGSSHGGKGKGRAQDELP